MSASGRGFAIVALLTVAVQVCAHDVIPRPDNQMVKLPPPGSYELQRIMQAPSGTVVDETGNTQQLGAYTGGKFTLLSFIYTRCGDTCPPAMGIQQLARQQLGRSAALRGKVRFVTISLDPAQDTPAVMKEYASHFTSQGDKVPWSFFTTRSDRQLKPLLDGFGQDVGPSDDVVDELTHVLKVFLIDPAHNVREIYSTSFLTPQVLVNDIETLAKEQGLAAD